jgi:hypothetical protein
LRLSAIARKILKAFESLDSREQHEVAVKILRLVRDDDGLEEELRASSAALSRMLDEEENGAQSKAR